MTVSRTSGIRGDVLFEAGAATHLKNAAAPLAENLFRGASNCAKIMLKQVAFERAFDLSGGGLTLMECIQSDESSHWPGVSTADLIRECERMGGDLMLVHDGFTGIPYHVAHPGDPSYAPFPSPGLGRYRVVAQWLARTFTPRFMVVLNEPFFADGDAAPITPQEYHKILLRVVPAIRQGSPDTTIIATGHPLWMADSALNDVVAEWHYWQFEDGRRVLFIPLPHNSPAQVRAALRQTINDMRAKYPKHEHFLGEIGLGRDAGEYVIETMLDTLRDLKMGYCNLVIGGMPRDELDPFALVDHGDSRPLLDGAKQRSDYSPAGVGWIAATKRLGIWREPEVAAEDTMNEEKIRYALVLLTRSVQGEPSLKTITRGEARQDERKSRRRAARAISLLEEALDV